MPDPLEAKFKIVTPMFLGGANQDTSDGIRPPSVKGALRFWWRALNWGRFRSSAVDDAAALRELHQKEARLFGIAGNEDGSGGQGCFLLRTSHGRLTSSQKCAVHGDLKNKAAARYLGYGLMEAFASKIKGTEAGQLTRACINEGQDFTVKLFFRHGVVDTLQEPLIAWGLLGGLGSRSRHGFGSVALQSLRQGGADLWKAPEKPSEYQTAVGDLLKMSRSVVAVPPFTAVGRDTRVDFLPHDRGSPFDVLDSFGRNLLMYRSWGKDGKVLGEDSEMNFRTDHDWSKGKGSAGFHPRRVVFGLPHNYGKGNNMEVKPGNHERRGSPLLFHVHLVGQTFVGVSILLPAMFLPPGETISAGGTQVTSNPDWTVLTDFLDGNRKSDGKPRFGGKVTV